MDSYIFDLSNLKPIKHDRGIFLHSGSIIKNNMDIIPVLLEIQLTGRDGQIEKPRQTDNNK
jgi:hypothetical protein